MSKTQTASDAIDLLENAAKRQAAEEKAEHEIVKARVQLILDRTAKGAFYATLAMRLRLVPCWSIDTAATDGKRLLYNPSFVQALTQKELVGVVCHEIMHCAMAHFARRNQRDMRKFNVACDCAINPIILESGLSLPDGCLIPGKGPHPVIAKLPENLSAEEYYSLLPDDDGEGGEGSDPGRCGGIMDAGDDSTQRQAEADWRVDVALAERAAKSRGEIPGGLRRFIDGVLAPVVSWKEILREFVRSIAKNDYSWTRPNRRFVAQGLYLPGLYSEEMGEIAISIDTSGSVGPNELERFSAELQGILECYPSKLTIIYHDSAVQQVDHWTPSDGDLKLDGKGGGGTSHVPVFEYLNGLSEAPEVLIALTDMCSSFPDAAPGYPVIWASTEKDAKTPGWGQLIHVKVD